jgi:hypothetical protein
VLVKVELEKRQRRWNQFLLQSRFELEVYVSAKRMPDSFVEPTEGASTSSN